MLQQICCTASLFLPPACNKNVATNLLHQKQCCNKFVAGRGQKQCCNKFVAPETMLQHICCTRNNVATNLLQDKFVAGRWQKQCCNKFVAPETMLQQICCRTVAATILQQICCNIVSATVLQQI